MGSYIKNYEIISDPFVDLEEHQQKFELPDDFSLTEELETAWGVRAGQRGNGSRG